MQLRLFSSPGEPFLSDILEASRDILQNHPDPVIAYLPAASAGRHFVRETRTAFKGIAKLVAIIPERHTPRQVRSALDAASLLYIPGGSTYLLAHLLHTTQVEGRSLFDEVRSRLLGGLPLVAFSAGSVLCGLDILTSNDANDYNTPHITGLGLLPFDLNVHFPSQSGQERADRLKHLEDLQADKGHKILALEDGACMRLTGEQLELARGAAWWVEAGKAPQRINPSEIYIRADLKNV